LKPLTKYYMKIMMTDICKQRLSVSHGSDASVDARLMRVGMVGRRYPSPRLKEDR
jgi:hypothetical protein